jgi:hypothetical protein
MFLRSGSTKVEVRQVGFSVSWGCSIVHQRVYFPYSRNRRQPSSVLFTKTKTTFMKERDVWSRLLIMDPFLLRYFRAISKEHLTPKPGAHLKNKNGNTG